VVGKLLKNMVYNTTQPPDTLPLIYIVGIHCTFGLGREVGQREGRGATVPAPSSMGATVHKLG
jgi:hypothetical protein